QGKTEPAGAPLEARLLAKQDTYTLDRGGQSAEEYATQVRDAAKRGAPLPTPRLELALELRNTGEKEIKILVGGDGSYVMLELQGPGAVSVRPFIASTFDYRASDVVAIAPGKSHVLTVSTLSFGHRGTTDTAYWTKPRDYTLTATYHTMVSPMPKGAQKAPDFLPDFGHVAATSAPIKLKVIERKPATEEPKPKESGKTDPASAPLEARLAARQDTYTLDRGGQSAEAYATQVRAAAKAGKPLPTPRVELTLELRNTGDQAIKILVGGAGSDVMLELQGPGAVSVRPRTVVSADYRASDVVAIAPGKSHVLTLSDLSFGHRGYNDLAYWTKAGDYTLTATYHTMVSPLPKGARKAPSFLPDFGHVAATSAPIQLKVIEKK